MFTSDSPSALDKFANWPGSFTRVIVNSVAISLLLSMDHTVLMAHDLAAPAFRICESKFRQNELKPRRNQVNVRFPVGLVYTILHG